jgi:hypothetical protein
MLHQVKEGFGNFKLSQMGNMDVYQARLKNALKSLGQLEEIEF